MGVGPAFLVDPIGACRGLAGIGAPYVGSACDSRGLRVLGAACAVGLGGGSRKGHGLGPAYEVVKKKKYGWHMSTCSLPSCFAYP